MQTLKVVMILFLLSVPITGVAHKVNVFATVENKSVTGEVFFADGKFCQNCKVELFDVSEKLMSSGVTDKNGAFQFSVLTKVPYKIVADAAMGHRAEMIFTDDIVDSSKDSVESLTSGRMILKMGLGLGSIICFFAVWGWVRKR